MEAQDIIQYIGFGLVGIVFYFLRGILTDVKNLKDEKTQNLLLQQRVDSNQENINRLETSTLENINKVESTMFKKFSGVHSREEKQRETNQELHTMLARIEGKLDAVLQNGK